MHAKIKFLVSSATSLFIGYAPKTTHLYITLNSKPMET